MELETLEQRPETLEQRYLRKYPAARIPPIDLTSTRMENKTYYFIQGNNIREGILRDSRYYNDSHDIICLVDIIGGVETEINFGDNVQLVQVFDKTKVQEINRRNMEGTVFGQNKDLPADISAYMNTFNKGGTSKRKRKRKTKKRRYLK